MLGSLYDEFSYALYRYTHNVIASGLLSETLQNTLLAQLGVSPWTPDGDWPLQVLPRTLTVLAQVSFEVHTMFISGFFDKVVGRYLLYLHYFPFSKQSTLKPWFNEPPYSGFWI